MQNQDLVIVVGAGPGIGAAVARAFAAKGHPILLIARSQSNLDALATDLTASGAVVTTATADAAKPGDLARVVSAVDGPISALVYNAAAFGGPLLAAGEDEMVSAAQVNLHSLVSVTAAARAGLKQGSGVLLTTGGGYALFPSAEYGVLSVGKAALRSASFVLAQELEADGIRVATITIAGAVAAGTAFAPDKIAQAYIAAFEDADAEIETVYTGE